MAPLGEHGIPGARRRVSGIKGGEDGNYTPNGHCGKADPWFVVTIVLTALLLSYADRLRS